MKQLQLIMLSLCGILVINGCKKTAEDTGGGGNNSEVIAPPTSLGLNSFYKKYIDADGVPVVSSDKVADEALIRAKTIVKNMLKLIPDAKVQMIQNKIKVGIIGKTERPTQMPEYGDLYTAFPGTDWDNRARAYGATIARPLTTNCEENMLCQANDRYIGEEILTHEFAHAIHELGLRFTVASFDNDLQAAFSNAKTKGLWTNTYAISDVREYWAEAVQCWFNSNLEAIPTNGVHNQINTRAELQTYDITIYNLLKKYFTDENIKHGCY